MRSIPLTFPPEEDELLGSWIYRLSKANLFDAPDQFVRTFIQPNKAHKYRYIKYKDDIEFSFFYQSLQSPTPMAELFLKTTCYAGYAPFITSGQQTRRINFIFRKSYGDSEFTPKHSPITSELRRCEQCQQEELSQNGFWYYHRAHQLPGVRVCHKHGCLLQIYQGQWGHEFDEDATFELAEENAVHEIMQQYAMFSKNILDAAPDTDIVGTKHALREALQQQGYVSRGQIHECIHSDIEQCGMSQICPSDVDHYIKVKLASLSYPSVEETMGMSFFLYRTAEAFLSALPKELPIPLYTRDDHPDYQLVGPYRKNLLQMLHTCGTEFCVTESGFHDGWSCPKCDSRYTSQEILTRLISHAGKGEYTVRAPFAGIDSHIDLTHKVCGRTFKAKPRSFLYEGARCICEGQQRKEALLDQIKDNSDFELLEYDSRSNHLTMRHSVCNQVFESNYDYFISNIGCPKCEGGIKTGIKKGFDVECLRERIKDVVGDEYTLESTEVQKGVPVLIRHSKCGKAQEYYSGRFLMGRRCSYCKEPISDKAKYELIPHLSSGEYQLLSIDINRRCVLHNCFSGEELEMDYDYAVQELTRPTPSPILPCQNTSQRIDTFTSREDSPYNRLLSIIRNTYTDTDVIFSEDLGAFGFNKSQVKHTVAQLSKYRKIERVYPGIYQKTGCCIHKEDVIHQRYILRKGVRIGYVYGLSFAYELGLIDENPDRVFIATNKESNLHGRDRLFLECPLHLRGSKTPVTDENWRILQLLGLLPNLSKYTVRSNEETEAILQDYIQKHKITYQQALPYLDLYPKWVDSMLQKLCP